MLLIIIIQRIHPWVNLFPADSSWFNHSGIMKVMSVDCNCSGLLNFWNFFRRTLLDCQMRLRRADDDGESKQKSLKHNFRAERKKNTKRSSRKNNESTFFPICMSSRINYHRSLNGEFFEMPEECNKVERRRQNDLRDLWELSSTTERK